jgi:hypothetical protein
VFPARLSFVRNPLNAFLVLLPDFFVI